MDQALKDALNQITAIGVSTQFAVGVALMYAIGKVFRSLEERLTENAKLEIAVWLLDNEPSSEERQFALPSFVTDYIDRMFRRVLPTEKSFSKTWKLLGLFTCVLAALSLLQPNSISRKILAVYTRNGGFEASNFFGSFFFTSLFAALGTHVALLATKRLTERVIHTQRTSRLYLLLLLNAVLALLFSVLGVMFLLILASFDIEVRQLVARWANRLPTIPELGLCFQLAITKTFPFVLVVVPMVLAELFTTAWVCSGITLKYLTGLANSIRVAPRWFNRNFDIEKKPLQSIGLVAGALVAIVYWVAVIVSRVVG